MFISFFFLLYSISQNLKIIAILIVQLFCYLKKLEEESDRSKILVDLLLNLAGV